MAKNRDRYICSHAGIRIVASTKKSITEMVERASCSCMTAATLKIVSSQCLRDSSLI